MTERVDDAAKQTFANRHLEELASGADFLPFLDAGVIAENNGADLGLFKVQRQAGDAVAEVEHFVKHGVGQALDLGDAVADFPHGADVLLRH